MTTLSARIPCGGYHHDACLPEVFRCFLQGQVDTAVIGADGKIHYSDIIFAGIVHYPSKGTNGLCRISLPFPVQNFDGNDAGVRGDAAVNTIRKGAVSAGNTRDMSHGIRMQDCIAIYAFLL